jgi:hypothetical protein
MNPVREQHQAYKARWSFEASVPRCETCVSYKSPRTKLTKDSRAIVIPAKCRDAGFDVRPASLCNRWKNQAGETIEVAES